MLIPWVCSLLPLLSASLGYEISGRDRSRLLASPYSRATWGASEKDPDSPLANSPCARHQDGGDEKPGVLENPNTMPAPPPCKLFNWNAGKLMDNGVQDDGSIATVQACRAKCKETIGCVAFNYDLKTKRCEQHSTKGSMKIYAHGVTGGPECTDLENLEKNMKANPLPSSLKDQPKPYSTTTTATATATAPATATTTTTTTTSAAAAAAATT